VNSGAAVKYLDLAPVERMSGSIRLPGSKSISNRTLLLAALAEGETLVRDLLDSDDTQHMLQALRTLGVRCEAKGAHTVRVTGTAGRFAVKQADLFLGNAGTVFRPLTAVLGILGGEYRLSGVPRMHQRPIGDLVSALRSIGAQIEYVGEEGYPPLQIHNSKLKLDERVTVNGTVSSQFVTGLLMALPLARERCEIEIHGELISQPYVELTLNTMRQFGVSVERQGWRRFTIAATNGYRSPGEIYVEGDASSASYFLAAGAISALNGGGPVRVEGVGRGSVQGDVRFTEILEQMGARITMGENWIEATAADEAVRQHRLRSLDADLNHIPDAAMTAAVTALFAEGTSTLRNIGSWRVKETDRLAAMATELRKLGAAVEEGADYLRITPPSRITPHAAIDTYDDHRIAMSFALVAVGRIPVRINEPECVRKTFPQYFEALASISKRRVP
jgi:3-phosphoshikimate 1-carboxyvinyltransferase